jgi:hypothetical protein
VRVITTSMSVMTERYPPCPNDDLIYRKNAFESDWAQMPIMPIKHIKNIYLISP